MGVDCLAVDPLLPAEGVDRPEVDPLFPAEGRMAVLYLGRERALQFMQTHAWFDGRLHDGPHDPGFNFRI